MSRATAPIDLLPYSRATAGAEDLRLDANEGSPPPSAARETAVDVSVYPSAAPLEAAIAADLGIDPTRVVVTAGASDALDRACRLYLRTGGELLVPTPAFGMLLRYAELSGGRVTRVPWWRDFPLDELLGAIGPATRMIALTSPNNPTGLALEADELRTVAAAAGDRPVLLDHVYAEFADRDLGQVALELPNVLLCRTFSKAWGLASCRIGYAVAEAGTAARLRAAGGAYPVSGWSIAVALQTYRSDRQGVLDRAAATCRRRERLLRFLASLGIDAPPSQANFVLARFGTRAETIWRTMGELGVRVRRFRDPELAGHLRITVPRCADEEERLRSALERALTDASEDRP